MSCQEFIPSIHCVIVSYENKIQPFVDYCDGGLISAVTIDTVDGFTNHLPKEQKDIKETCSNEQLEKLLAKPDLNSCSFTEFKTWVFENYMLATGNRHSTALNVHIKDIDLDNGNDYVV